MAKDKIDKAPNKITLNGITFKTKGNIIFGDSDEKNFHLAQSALLEKMDGVLEHGLQMLLKKIKA